MTRRKDGLWQQSVTVIVSGRKVQKYFYGKTKAEVLKKIQAYTDEQATGPTFAAVADEWWEQHEPTLAANTLKGYRPALHRAKEHFGDRRIRQITPAGINQFLRDVIKKINAAHKTAATQLMVINLICRYAVENGYIPSNPARDVSLPRGLAKTTRKMPEPEDLQRIKDSTDVPFGMFAFWALYTGCRRGELLALTWEDIDMKGRWVNVSKSLYYSNGKAEIKEPKTQAGIRQIPLVDKLAEKLKPGKGLIFANGKGGHITETQFQRAWGGYRETTGITCTPHQIRHAYATMLFENSVAPKDAQRILGHAQLSTTMDIYTHIRAEQAERVKKQLLNIDISSPSSVPEAS